MVALSLVIALVAILLVNESSHLAKAADGPKTVWGVVYDGTDQPVAGATVTVSMKYGLGSTRSQLSFGPTDVDGYYLVVFDRSQWMEHDTIEVTATRSGGDSATNSTEATLDGNQQVDVHFPELIPEFANPVFVTTSLCLVVVFIFGGLKKRRRSAPVE